MSLLRCSCEASYCTAHNGGCQQAATMALTIFGYKQELCSACYQIAQATNPDKITEAVGLL